jgi:hypothetical protein
VFGKRGGSELKDSDVTVLASILVMSSFGLKFYMSERSINCFLHNTHQPVT